MSRPEFYPEIRVAPSEGDAFDVDIDQDATSIAEDIRDLTNGAQDVEIVDAYDAGPLMEILPASLKAPPMTDEKLEQIAAYGQALARHGTVFLAALSDYANTWDSVESAESRCRDFVGRFSSYDDYARDYWDQSIPAAFKEQYEVLSRYVDWHQVGKDMASDGEIVEYNGDIFVFGS